MGKKRVRVACMALVVFLCVSVFTACVRKEDRPNSDPDNSGSNQPVTGGVTEGSAGDNPEPEKPDGSLIRMDEDGLVQVWIDDGDATLWFDLKRWDSLHDIFNADSNKFGD